MSEANEYQVLPVELAHLSKVYISNNVNINRQQFYLAN